MYFIGVDIGTSGTKAVCMDEAGNIKNSWFVSYGFEHTAFVPDVPISTPIKYISSYPLF